MTKDSTIPADCHQYSVDAESTLGVAITTYLRRCKDSIQAICDFLPTVSQYDFPVPVTEYTEYLTSDDCDAGGLLAIIAHESDLAGMTPRAKVLWDTMPYPSDDDPDAIAVFPRIEAKTHYIRYSRAVSLHSSAAAGWDFLPPSSEDKQKGRVVRTVTLSSVRRTISKDDLAALAHKGKAPDPTSKMLLAPCRKYDLVGVSLSDTAFSDEEQQNLFSEAIQLFKAFSSLPSVAANTLARTLRLDGQDIKHPCCEWRFDKDANRYIITTNLSSSLVEMKEIVQH